MHERLCGVSQEACRLRTTSSHKGDPTYVSPTVKSRIIKEYGAKQHEILWMLYRCFEVRLSSASICLDAHITCANMLQVQKKDWEGTTVDMPVALLQRLPTLGSIVPQEMSLIGVKEEEGEDGNGESSDDEPLADRVGVQGGATTTSEWNTHAQKCAKVSLAVK